MTTAEAKLGYVCVVIVVFACIYELLMNLES